MKQKIKMFGALLLLCAGILIVMSATASASAINTDTSDISKLSGNLGYIKKASLYYLDMEKTDLMDWMYKIMNDIANLVFVLIRWIGQCVCMIFYYCMNFNLAEMFESEIGEIQKALRSNIFEPLFLLAFSGSAVIILKKMVRRDLMGSFGQVLKVIGILVLSFWIIRDSGTAITATTNITKGISCQAITGMAGVKTTDLASYAANAAGTLWYNLIHQPWKYIEFGDDPVSDADIESIWLNDDYKHGNTKRDDEVAAYTGSAFNKERGGERLGFMILYLIPFLIKSVIYIVMSVLSLVFQLIALLWLFMAPIVLLLAMVPGYEGIISTWLRKMLEAQLSILIMSFIIGLLIKVDDILFSKGGKAWGWLIVLIVQTVLAVFVIIKRDELLGAFSSMGVANPSASINQSLHDGKKIAQISGKAAVGTGSLAARGISAADRKTGEIVKTGFSAGKINRQTAIMEAASNYQRPGQYWKERKKKVDRPVMAAMPAAAGAEEKVVPGPGYAAAGSQTTSRMANAPVSAQNAPRIVQRPRMDEWSRTEPILDYRGSEESKPKVERPVMSQAVRKEEKAGKEATVREVRSRPSTAAPASTEAKQNVAGQSAANQIRKESVAERAKDSQSTKSRPVKRPQSSVPPKPPKNAQPKADPVKDAKENVNRANNRNLR